MDHSVPSRSGTYGEGGQVDPRYPFPVHSEARPVCDFCESRGRIPPQIFHPRNKCRFLLKNRCGRCGKLGHSLTKCKQPLSETTCPYCHKVGHDKYTCAEQSSVVPTHSTVTEASKAELVRTAQSIAFLSPLSTQVVTEPRLVASIWSQWTGIPYAKPPQPSLVSKVPETELVRASQPPAFLTPSPTPISGDSKPCEGETEISSEMKSLADSMMEEHGVDVMRMHLSDLVVAVEPKSVTDETDETDEPECGSMLEEYAVYVAKTHLSNPVKRKSYAAALGSTAI